MVQQNQTDSRKTKKTVVNLVVIAVAMFGFGFALVPLYSVFCEVTGLNGKTQGRYEGKESAVIDNDRWVKVQFVTSLNAEMPWTFKPKVSEIRVQPGKMNKALFVATNNSRQAMVGQAVPSISPGLSAQYFKKTECFCFNRQQLDAGKTVEMPVVFMLDPELPEEYKTITLSYTMFDTENMQIKSSPKITGKLN